MGDYQRPSKRIHRGFIYLNDETVANSLSTLEAGKVDEVVAKAVTAREGGFSAGGSAGLSSSFGAKAEGGKKASSSLEEEMTRTRTRFSIFQIWYDVLIEQGGMGRFNGWSASALADVQPGDTVEVRMELELLPIQVLMRLYKWFASMASAQGNMFSQKGEELKATKEALRNMEILSGGDIGAGRFVLLGTPMGGEGPRVAMDALDDWVIGPLGDLAGLFTVVGQVAVVLNEGEKRPTMRLTRDTPATALESNLMDQAVSTFVEPAKAIGVNLTGGEGHIEGPALWLEPIAIFR